MHSWNIKTNALNIIDSDVEIFTSCIIDESACELSDSSFVINFENVAQLPRDKNKIKLLTVSFREILFVFGILDSEQSSITEKNISELVSTNRINFSESKDDMKDKLYSFFSNINFQNILFILLSEDENHILSSSLIKLLLSKVFVIVLDNKIVVDAKEIKTLVKDKTNDNTYFRLEI